MHWKLHMTVFTETFGLSPEVLRSFIQWLLTAVTVIFASFVIKGSYARWVKGDSQAFETWFDVSLAMMVLSYIGWMVN